MSKKLYQKLYDQNQDSIARLESLEILMPIAESRNNFVVWNRFNNERNAIISDLRSQLDAAYHATPVKSVKEAGMAKFWELVNHGFIDYDLLERTIESNRPKTKADLKSLILSMYPKADLMIVDYTYLGTVTGAIAIVNGNTLPSKKGYAFSIYK